MSNSLEASMEAKLAVSALSALAHEHRLAAYRLLVEAGPDGVPPSSLTFHLQQLLHAGLATQRRASRQLIYAADFAAMNNLVGYLTENCCGHGTEAAPACNPACLPVVPAAEGTARTRRKSA